MVIDTSKWSSWVKYAVFLAIAVFVVMWLFPKLDWLMVSLVSLLGIGGGGVSSKILKQASDKLKEDTERVEQERKVLTSMDARLQEQQTKLKETAANHQQLVINVSGKVKQAQEQLQQVKSDIAKENMSVQDAENYLRGELKNEGK